MLNFFKKKQEVVTVGKPSTEGKLDIYSPTWVFIKTWAEGKLIEYRELNDHMKNDELKTASLRGRIKLLKEILALGVKSDGR